MKIIRIMERVHGLILFHAWAKAKSSINVTASSRQIFGSGVVSHFINTSVASLCFTCFLSDSDEYFRRVYVNVLGLITDL